MKNVLIMVVALVGSLFAASQADAVFFGRSAFVNRGVAVRGGFFGRRVVVNRGFRNNRVFFNRGFRNNRVFFNRGFRNNAVFFNRGFRNNRVFVNNGFRNNSVFVNRGGAFFSPNNAFIRRGFIGNGLVSANRFGGRVLVSPSAAFGFRQAAFAQPAISSFQGYGQQVFANNNCGFGVCGSGVRSFSSFGCR